tara:strand:+ start:165 stop:521 length:357 start_codon:yes stop_codon:yes gene_type:complete
MNHSDPYTFSRGSLKLTYDLLRRGSPALALTVRNITSTVPLPKLEGDIDNPLTDCFLLSLDSFQVQAVVEGLASCGQHDASSEGFAIVAQALLEDWMALACAMIVERSDGERSEKQRP